MNPAKISVVMPCFNERATVREIVARVLAQPFDIELIVVDDGSSDGTREILAALAAEHPAVRVCLQPVNQGKGAALHRGFREATGDVVLIQDADLEYDPHDYAVLLEPILTGRADVVYGSRFLGGSRRVLYYWHSIANWMLTTMSNMVSNLNLTDMETCYKAFRREVIQSLTLREERFGFEPEVTVKLSRVQGIRVYEVPISYNGRTYEEGKKIGLKDAVRAVYVLGRHGLLPAGRG